MKRIRSKIENNNSNKKLKSHGKHFYHEFAHYLHGDDLLQLNSNTGKGHNIWVKVGFSQSGDHKQSIKTIAQPLRLSAAMETKLSSMNASK